MKEDYILYTWVCNPVVITRKCPAIIGMEAVEFRFVMNGGLIISYSLNGP
jgi:hypothetical protein